MVATRKSKVLPEPVSATDSADADSEETQNFNYERKQGLSRLRLGKSTDIENVRVWPLCFAIAIEKSRRIRPGIMVASSAFLQASHTTCMSQTQSCWCVFVSTFVPLGEPPADATPAPFLPSITADRTDFIAVDGFHPRRDRHPVRRVFHPSAWHDGSGIS